MSPNVSLFFFCLARLVLALFSSLLFRRILMLENDIELDFDIDSIMRLRGKLLRISFAHLGAGRR
jgi:hypothetical protein